MDLIKAKPEHFEDYIRLQNEFTESNKTNQTNICNSLEKAVKSENLDFENIYRAKLEQENSYFTFVKNNDNICGFLYGYFVNLPSLFAENKVGYLDTVFISKECRGKGLSSVMKDEFLSWLKEREIKNCRVNIVTTNENAIAIYKKWGFTTNEKLLTREL